MAKVFTNTKCVYCLRFFEKLTSDHVFPESVYPDTTPENVRKIQVPACDECNQKFRKNEDELLQKIRMSQKEQRIIPLSQEKICLLGEKLVRGITYDKRTKYIDGNRKVEVSFVHVEDVEPRVKNLLQLGAQDCSCSGISILMVFANDDSQTDVFFIELWGQFYIYIKVLPREENVGETVATIRLQTIPKAISKEILEFCKEIDETQEPDWVSVKTDPESKIDECFFNVKNKVKKDGGIIQFGWEIWEWQNKWQKLFIEGVFHAIWISPENERIDITPKIMNDKKILFMPDSAREYNFNSDFYRVAGRYKPLSDDPLVAEFIKLSKQIFDAEKRLFPGRRIDPENPVLKELQDKRAWIYLQLQSIDKFQTQSVQKKPKLNAPCPCGSGRKFKKCCGKRQMNTRKQNK
jgi:hypothetical protein